LTTVLRCVGRTVGYAVGAGVAGVAAAVYTEVCGESDGGAEAEKNTQCIKSDVENGDAELLDERSWEEVEQGEEPPYTHEQGVVNDGVYASVRACDVVTHQRSDDDGTDELPCSETEACGLHI